MRHQEWMERDERTPEQIQRDRIRHLQVEEAAVMRRLESIQAEIATIPAFRPTSK